MIDVDKDYEGDVSDEESGTRQEVKMNKVYKYLESDHVNKNNECDAGEEDLGTRREVSVEKFRGELDGDRVEKLQEINKSVRDFDRYTQKSFFSFLIPEISNNLAGNWKISPLSACALVRGACEGKNKETEAE